MQKVVIIFFLLVLVNGIVTRGIIVQNNNYYLDDKFLYFVNQDTFMIINHLLIHFRNLLSP